MRGYTIAYCADAYAVENGSADMHEEEKRKVRIAAGGLQSVWRLRALLNPLRYGVFCFQYISHRVLRWSLTPVLLFLLFPLNTILIFTSNTLCSMPSFGCCKHCSTSWQAGGITCQQNISRIKYSLFLIIFFS